MHRILLHLQLQQLHLYGDITGLSIAKVSFQLINAFRLVYSRFHYYFEKEFSVWLHLNKSIDALYLLLE